MAALTQVEWQALIDAARECKRKGTSLHNAQIPIYGSYPEGNDNTGVSGVSGKRKDYDLVNLIIRAVVDATTQMAGTTNTNSVTAIAANTIVDG